MVSEATQIQETFGEVEEVYGGSQPVPKDRYTMEVLKAEPRSSDETGNWWVEADCKILVGQETGDEYAGRHIFPRMFLSTTKKSGEPSKALGMTKTMLDLMLGEVPSSVQAISKYDQQGLAEAISAALPGAVFDGDVYIQKDEDFGDKNQIGLPRKNRK